MLFAVSSQPNKFIWLIVTLMLAVGCSSTQLDTAWKAPNTGPISFKQVVVLVINTEPAERRAQEDELAAQVKKAKAIPAHTFIPDSDLDDREKVKQKIVQSGSDGAVVVRLMETRKETTYVPPQTSYWDEGPGYAASRYGPGTYITNTVVRAEVSLYSVPDGKLLWAGSSTTTDPANARSFAMQVARAASAELRRQGLLK